MTTKVRLTSGLLVLMLLTLLVVGACAAPAPATPAAKWRFQSTVSPDGQVQKYLVDKFIELVNQRLKGKLEIEGFLRDAIVKRAEAFDATRKGIIEASLNIGTDYASVFPEGNVEFGLTMSLLDLPMANDFYYKYQGGAFFKMLDEAYKERGLHLLSLNAYTNSLLLKFPMNKVEDMKGKKIRVVGLPTTLVKNMGGVPVNLSAAEMYTALQRGTVDGTIYPPYGLITSSLHEVVSYHIVPSIGVQGQNIVVNAEAFNKLPADVKKVLEDTAIEANAYYTKEYDAAEAADIKTAETKYGIKTITLPKEEVAKMLQAALPSWDEVAAKSPRCGALVDLTRSYLKEKGLLK
ncbi:MAG: TRAP transporter substrate-binding protein DctP [Chloroflexota bacterium]